MAATENTNNTTSSIMAFENLRNPQYVFIALLVPLVLLGSFGNAMVVIAPISERKLRTTFYGMISFLAFIDFTVCAFVIPMAILGQFMKTTGTFCKLMAGLKPHLSILSLHVQCIIGYSRYKLITSPLDVQNKLFRWKFAVGITVIPSILNSVMFMGVAQYHSSSNRCMSFADNTYRKLVVLGLFIIVPILLTFIFYTKMFRFLGKCSITLERQRFRQARLSKVMFQLFLAWVLGYSSTVVIRLSDDKGEWPSEVYQVSWFLLWLNSAANPILYSWKSSEFKRFLAKLCGFFRRSNAVVPIIPKETRETDVPSRRTSPSRLHLNTTNTVDLHTEIISVISIRQPTVYRPDIPID